MTGLPSGGLAYAPLACGCGSRTGGGLGHHPAHHPGPVQILQVSRPVVQQLIRSGDLPATELSRQDGWKISRLAFEAWVQAQYADTRGWIAASPPTSAGMWGRHTGGPARRDSPPRPVLTYDAAGVGPGASLLRRRQGRPTPVRPAHLTANGLCPTMSPPAEEALRDTPRMALTRQRGPPKSPAEMTPSAQKGRVTGRPAPALEAEGYAVDVSAHQRGLRAQSHARKCGSEGARKCRYPDNEGVDVAARTPDRRSAVHRLTASSVKIS